MTTDRIISRADVGEPDLDEGYQDLTTEAEARAWLDSDEVQRRLCEYWRVELRHRPPGRTVDSPPYRSTTSIEGDQQ